MRMKKCPFCAAAIPKSAIFCRHCWRDLKTVTPQEAPLVSGRFRWGLMLVLGLIASSAFCAYCQRRAKI